MTRLIALCVFLSLPAFAASKGDWFASLYTGEGVELRNDERIFTLFAVFNASGFDAGPVTRKDPVPRIVYHPVRSLVRSRVIGGDPEVKRAAETFFDAHPTALRKYLSYAVAADQPPFAAGAKAKDLQELKGLEAVLAKAWTAWKLEELMGTVQADYRRSLKTYLTVTDAPLTKARATLKIPESQEALIVVNLLDATDQVRAVEGENKEAIIIVGPSEKPNVEGVIREYARLTIEPAVARQVGKWAGGVAVLKEAQLAGATESTLQEYASSAISQAIALRATDANDAAFEAAASRGYFGIKDISRLFDEGKPLDTIVLDAMQKLETRRPAKK
ncbi:MAG: hypothetical protein DI536_11850 [Archangium gephyra]|uniref:DUF2059 domain-containing protein n=1 Tax=Archangium gephyra TaxID=48 RepID=A0A2W5VD97_9BACT|nr:MAG: hypothetical protein DI536_11850 [Archangium gephyra]